METKHTRKYAAKSANEYSEYMNYSTGEKTAFIEGYMMAVEQTAAPELLEALVGLINSINPEDACRGKYKDFQPENPEIAKKAYVGAKSTPADEQILKALEAIEKATK